MKDNSKEHNPAHPLDTRRDESCTGVEEDAAAFGTSESSSRLPRSALSVSYCDQLIIALLLVIIIAVPLYFGVNLYSVFDLSKITVLYILSFTILAIWSIKTIIICWTSPARVTSGTERSWYRAGCTDAGQGMGDEAELSIVCRSSSIHGSRWGDILGNAHFPYLLAQPLNLPIIAFLFVSGLATFFSINPYISLAGTYKRYDGLISIFVYVFLFYAVVNFIQRRRLGLLLNVIILTACLASIYGVFQHFGMDMYQWNTNFGFGIRACSTFGHPAFFSAFLTMVIPLVLIKIFSDTRSLKLEVRASKPFCLQLSDFSFLLSIGILALLLIAFYYTKTRASFLGLVISNLFFFFLIGKKALLADKAKTIITLTVLIGVSLFYNISDKASVTGRFFQDMKPALLESDNGSGHLAGTMRMRVLQYMIGLKIIQDYPILGIGPDTLGIIYPQYYAMVYAAAPASGKEKGESTKPSLAHVSFENQNRIHNDFMDVAVSRGLLGLGVYLWFIFAYSRMVWKACLPSGIGYKKSAGGESVLKRTYSPEGTTDGLSATTDLFSRESTWPEARDKILIIGICSGCMAYFIQNQFSFGHIPIITLFWFLIGMSVIACREPERFIASCRAQEEEQKTRDVLRTSSFVSKGAGGQPLKAEPSSCRFGAGQILTKWFNNPTLERLVKTVACGLMICLMILLITITLFFYKADIYFNNGRKFLNKDSMIKAIGNYEMAVRYNPLEINYRNVLSNVYLKMAAISLNTDNNNISVQPPDRQSRSEGHPGGEEDKPGLSAQEQTTMWLANTIMGAREVQRLYPKDYRSAFTLGQAYHLLDGISNKDMSKDAIKYYKRAITLHPFMFKLRDKLAQLYVEKGHYQDAVPELKEAIRIEPNNPLPYINLTNVFIKLGRYEEARKLCNRILELKLKGSGNNKYHEYAKSKLEFLSKPQSADLSE